jgi:hypothetical protein
VMLREINCAGMMTIEVSSFVRLVIMTVYYRVTFQSVNPAAQVR